MIFNFGKQKPQYKPGTLLFDHYDGQVGLPVKPGYDEITLTATADKDKIQMDVYHRPTGNDAVESKASYLVSSKAFDDAMKLVKKHKLTEWNKRNYPAGLCGRKTICKFMWNNEFLHVSSENMPENGKEIFAEIHAALCGYADTAAVSEASGKSLTATLKVTNIIINTMAMSADGDPQEPEKAPEPEIITVRIGSRFYDFTVTEIKEDHIRFNANFFRYIINDGPIEKEFIIRKGETLRLNMVDILDAKDLTVVELSDIAPSDRQASVK